MSIHTSTQKGNHAEQISLNLLRENGLKAVTENYRSKLGEIDLIMEDPSKKTLVFVEVRYRKNNRFGSPAESISAAKIRKISRTADYFLLRNSQYKNWNCRFDVVAITGNLTPQWIVNAFLAA